MISQEHAERLAHECGEAWNRHDLNGIMAHYADEVVFTSPFVPILANEPTATLRGTPKYAPILRKALPPILKNYIRITRCAGGDEQRDAVRSECQ